MSKITEYQSGEYHVTIEAARVEGGNFTPIVHVSKHVGGRGEILNHKNFVENYPGREAALATGLAWARANYPFP
jgi:hypothetical protein